MRFGRRWRSELDEVARTNLTTIEAAMLAAIGLLLAFSLNMAVTRFDQRRELLVGEVNAIGTAWLRSGLCPEPTRTRLRSELRTYAQSRAELFGGANIVGYPKLPKVNHSATTFGGMPRSSPSPILTRFRPGS